MCLFMTIIQWLPLEFQIIRRFMRKVSRNIFFSNVLKTVAKLRNNDELQIATSNYLPFRLDSLTATVAIPGGQGPGLRCYVRSVLNSVYIMGTYIYVLNKNRTVYSLALLCFLLFFPCLLRPSASILTLVFSLPKNFFIYINYT